MSVDNRQLPVRRALSPTTGLIILTVAVTTATVWSYRYFGKYSPYASLLSQQNTTLPQITLTIQNPRISVRSGGHRRLLASARQVSFSRDSRTVFVDNIHDGVLFDDSGKRQVEFDAGQMTYNTPSGDIATTVGSTIQLNQGIHATIIRPSTTARAKKPATGPPHLNRQPHLERHQR